MLDMFTTPLFEQWAKLVHEALGKQEPFNVPSWPQYRRQHQQGVIR